MNEVDNTKEMGIKSNGKIEYIDSIPPLNNISGFIAVARDTLDDSVIHLYKNDDQSCEFYYERPEGRKKYWKEIDSMPTDTYTTPSSNGQSLIAYSEIEGVVQEWYYEFINFDKMMSFVNSHAPISLNPGVEAEIKDNPLSRRPESVVNPDYMCAASLAVTALGNKVTTIYLEVESSEFGFFNGTI